MMSQAEAILIAAGCEFRQQFEQELRQRLLDVATAEIEYIVQDVSRTLCLHSRMDYNTAMDSHNIHFTAKVVK